MKVWVIMHRDVQCDFNNSYFEEQTANKRLKEIVERNGLDPKEIELKPVNADLKVLKAIRLNLI